MIVVWSKWIDVASVSILWILSLSICVIFFFRIRLSHSWCTFIGRVIIFRIKFLRRTLIFHWRCILLISLRRKICHNSTSSIIFLVKFGIIDLILFCWRIWIISWIFNHWISRALSLKSFQLSNESTIWVDLQIREKLQSFFLL